MKRLVLLLAVAVLAGCGGGETGRATLWITRDGGAHLMLSREVPAGLTAMQTLDRVANIETRYGGRYVQAINGFEGSLRSRRDWFYFINGYEGDRSAAEYRLRDGDVEWWDFRSWKTRMREPVVVGAFPEPFLHGYAGKRLPVRVVYLQADQREDAEKVAELLGGRAVSSFPQAQRAQLNVLVLEPASSGEKARFLVSQRRGVGPGKPVWFRFRGDAELLLRDPPFGRFRYLVEP